MQKANFIRAVAEKAGVTQPEARQIVDAALAVITEALRRGERVTLWGFGTFQVRARQARAGVNPQTNEKIQIPALTTPGFSASAALKEAVNGAYSLSDKAPSVVEGAPTTLMLCLTLRRRPPPHGLRCGSIRCAPTCWRTRRAGWCGGQALRVEPLLPA